MTSASHGKLFFVVGPSGAGKDTLLAGALAADPSLHWAQRVISRPQTGQGEPFEPCTEAQFQARLAAGEFALHWQAHGLFYGVPHAQLAPLAAGQTVLLNGSRGAIAQARAAFPQMQILLITAPAALLAQRLAARGRESRADIEARLARADLGLPEGVPYLEVSNDGAPEIGIARLLQAIRG
jgi:phosphonate metabolism protein PhnN/1,5-bisphosphokinase (PRPP-forming)